METGLFIGRIGLSFSTASRTYELSEETHVTPFHTYRFHSTGLCNYKPQERTYRRTTYCRYRLTVRKYCVQSNVFHTYGRVSRGLFPRVRRYGLLYLRTVEYDQCFCKRPTERNCNTRVHYWFDFFCKRHMTITVELLYSTIGGVHEMRSCYRRIVVK